MQIKMTKQTLAAAITRYERYCLAAKNEYIRDYWFDMMEAAQEQLDTLNVEQSDAN